MKLYYALARIYLSRNEADKAIAQYEEVLKKNFSRRVRAQTAKEKRPEDPNV
jgi:hypothetical protein